MTNISEADLIGRWKTDKDVIITIDSCIEIPAQKVWVGKTDDGKQIYFTTEGRPLFNEIGELVTRRRGNETW